MTTTRPSGDRPDHAGDHPELAAGDQRRDVRRVPQDRDERDHLRGARHGHRHHRRARATSRPRAPGIPAFVGVLDKAVKRIIELNDGRTRSGPATSSSRTTRSTAASRISTTSCSRCRSSRAASSIAWTANIAHWNDVGGMVPGSISNEATRDLPGGPAAAGGQARSRRASRSSSVMEIMKVQQPAARLPAGRHVGRHRRGPRRRAADRSSSSRSTASRRSARRCAHFMDYGEQVARRALADLPKGHVHAGGGAGQRRRLQRRRSRSPTTSSSSTCATTPTRTTGRTTPRRDGVDGRRADGLHERHRRRTPRRTRVTSGR